MKHQIITTEHGEELIVLTRRQYDCLLAAAGDEDAEDRMSVILFDEARARIESGEDSLVEVEWPAHVIASVEEALAGRETKP